MLARLIFLVSLASSFSPPLKNPDCFALLYKEFSREDCAKNFEFLSNTESVQRMAFTSGKSCALKIVKEKCSFSDYHNITENYDRIVDDIVTRPKNKNNCLLPYYYYNLYQCEVIMKSVVEPVEELSALGSVNDTRTIAAIRRCEEAKLCMDSSCYTWASQRKELQNAYESIKTQTPPFMFCLSKIRQETPNFSNYSCLNNDTFLKPTYHMFTTNTNCTKLIMRDYCGDLAVGNFNQYSAILLTKIGQE